MRGDPSQPVEQHPSPVGPLSILYVGAPEGTAAQRARILGELGHRVRTVEAGIPLRTSWRYQIHRVVRRIKRPGAPLAPFRDLLGANRATARRAAEAPLDVLWVDKGLSIRPETLQAVRTARPSSVSVSFSLDDMLNPVHQSQAYLACIPLYDLHVTTKSYHVEELARLGARRVLFVDNGYDPQVHRPLELSDADRARFAAEIGFVGHHERERAEMILGLCREGLAVRVHGPAWRQLRGAHPRLEIGEEFLDGLDYSKAINATDINLGFLRKANRDLQTTRSVEIPACGGFLLAERSDEHRRLFEEGREAEFFGSFPELLEKCRRARAEPEARRRIAEAGHRRCLASDYSYQAQLGRVLAEIERLRRTRVSGSGR